MHRARLFGLTLLIALLAWVGCAPADMDDDDEDDVLQDVAGLATLPWKRPAAGATVKGRITLEATGTARTARMAFFVDGVNVGRDASGPPWTPSLDTTKHTDGRHELAALARNANGKKLAAGTITVTFANGGGGGAAARRSPSASSRTTRARRTATTRRSSRSSAGWA